MTIAEKIITLAIHTPPKTEADLNVLKRTALVQKRGGTNEGLPNKTQLLSAYHTLVKKKSIQPNKALEKLLTRRAVRTLSGVTIVTSLVKPYPCPGECVYCPLDERMPKSYLSEEPAAMRALLLQFDPYEQMAKRIEALEANGHPTDKIELIIKGGTWNSYPLAYQYWFILESFMAANETGRVPPSPYEGEVGRGLPSSATAVTSAQKSATSPTPSFVRRGNQLTETSSLNDLKKELFKQQRLNEKAKHRIIGLTLETRPDCINYHTIWQMREQGCTRIELGIQHTDDAILKLTKRGHDSAAAIKATELLKNYGYKTDFHLMPQLPGATPEQDLAMMEEIFENPAYRPDMIKIYPCTVVKGSELFDWFENGKYEAYSVRELIDILKIFKSHIPYYARVSRLIRDIPGQYIEEGNKVTNLRQVIQDEMKRDGLVCKCLRCREVGHVMSTIQNTKYKIQQLKPKLFIDEYETNGGTEYFLSYEDAKRRMVFAFCRLRVVDTPVHHPNKKLNSYEAYIRELHTYGQLVRIGKKQTESTQHKGLGKKLVREAERITKKCGILKLAVISGVGVRDYYRGLGYRLEKTYMVKNF